MKTTQAPESLHAIRYIRPGIGCAPQPIVGSKLAVELIKAKRAAHATLERRFGSGTRGLLITSVRRVNATVIDPTTLAYIADFPHRWLEGAPDIPMTPSRWRRLAARMDRRRQLLMPGQRDKHARAIKAASAACRARSESPICKVR